MKLIQRTPPAPPVWDYQPLAARIGWMVVRFVWGCRVELAVTVALVWLWLAAAARLADAGHDDRLAVLAPLGLVLAIVAVSPARRVARRLLWRSWLRRRWDAACRYAELATLNDRVPRIVRLRSVAVGEALRVRVPAGINVTQLEAAAETLAAVLGLREVRVERDEANARLADVTLVRHDPLIDVPPIPWPLAADDAPVPSLWEQFPIGIGEDGEPVSISLVERNLLLGGEPGAGKSVALSILVAVAALDTAVQLWLLDGKRVELGLWKPCAHRFVGPDLAGAVQALRDLQSEMDRRYDWLEAQGRRKIAPGDPLPLVVVACDELAYYLTATARKPDGKPDRDASKEFANLFRDLVSRGRAAGIIAIAATQKPSSDIVPTALRDLFGFRWALRCSTRDASDTILGAGWATLGYSAATIPGRARGVGYLLAEGETPARLRSYYIDDDALAQLAFRAETLRALTPVADRSAAATAR